MAIRVHATRQLNCHSELELRRREYQQKSIARSARRITPDVEIQNEVAAARAYQPKSSRTGARGVNS